MKHSNNFIWFDLFRGIAALLVLAGHLRALIFQDFTQSKDILSKFFYFFTGFGHQAVIIFFVLSGFFIIRSIIVSVQNNHWLVRDYIINRLVRLWVVLIPALLMTLMFDLIGLCFFRNSYTYSGLISQMSNINPNGKLGMLDFIGNLFFLQTIIVQPYGSNAPLWSLANEFWYYLLFPIGYFSIIKMYKIWIRISLIITFLVVLWFIGNEISSYFIIWLMGGTVYLKDKYTLTFKFNNLLFKILGIFLFLLTLISVRFVWLPQIFNDYSLGFATTLILCVFSEISMENKYLVSISKKISEISYTIYLTHISFAILLVSLIFRNRVLFSTKYVLIYGLILVVIIIYSYLVYYLFERNTNKVKEIIRSWIN